MTGMDAATGRALSGDAHLRQSIADILTTPVGSRVMRRDYGSRLMELVDAPLTRGTLVQIYAATAQALARWEPRLDLKRLRASSSASGRLRLLLEGTLRDGSGAGRSFGIAL